MIQVKKKQQNEANLLIYGQNILLSQSLNHEQITPQVSVHMPRNRIP